MSTLLSNTQERIYKSNGKLFCDTGEIRSRNDEKHIFLSIPEGGQDEGNRIVCDIMRIANRTGVAVRILSVPTNLRGEYVFLNLGETSIDGHFKSHNRC